MRLANGAALGRRLGLVFYFVLVFYVVAVAFHSIIPQVFSVRAVSSIDRDCQTVLTNFAYETSRLSRTGSSEALADLLTEARISCHGGPNQGAFNAAEELYYQLEADETRRNDTVVPLLNRFQTELRKLPTSTP